MLGSELVKREFLAGLQGGDGGRIRCNSYPQSAGHGFVCRSLTMTKVEEHAPTLYKFMCQVDALFNYLGIQTLGVQTQRLADRPGVALIGVKVSDDQQNLVNLFDRVGYRYDHYKLVASAKVVEFLRYRCGLRTAYRQCVQLARDLHDQGRTAVEISHQLDMPRVQVTNLLQQYKRGGAIGAPHSTAEEKPETWLPQITSKGKFIFVPVSNVTSRPCGLVGDLTTASSTHSFIAGDGFAVHNCIPSRMTIGHLVEALASKVAALSGRVGDGTPFTDVSAGGIGRELCKQGYSSKGTEVMYCGRTGRRLEAEIYLAPTYYQRLKHMVDDKIHARGRGPKTALTGQPVEGRARMGGLRFGEMERDCVIAHGATAFIQERLLYSSDVCTVPICENCGYIAIQYGHTGRVYCTVCERRWGVREVQMPYATKLLLQELMSMAIMPTLKIQ